MKSMDKAFTLAMMPDYEVEINEMYCVDHWHIIISAFESF